MYTVTCIYLSVSMCARSVSLQYLSAIDSVRHQTLMQKMQLPELPGHVYIWVVTSFEGRGHATKLHDSVSRVAPIRAFITQGSVVGPPSDEIVASDLHPEHPANKLSKYANDTCTDLMVGSNNIDTISEEFTNFRSRATSTILDFIQMKPKK